MQVSTSEAIAAQFSAPIRWCEERVLTAEGNRPNGSFDAVVVDLKAAVSETQPFPVVDDVVQDLAER